MRHPADGHGRHRGVLPRMLTVLALPSAQLVAQAGEMLQNFGEVAVGQGVEVGGDHDQELFRSFRRFTV
jgi:hypothetical protein